jgi:hypothetical protein
MPILHFGSDGKPFYGHLSCYGMIFKEGKGKVFKEYLNKYSFCNVLMIEQNRNFS